MNTAFLLMTLTNQFYKAVGFCGYHLFYKQCLQHFERQIRMENGIETCIIFYKKRNASPGSMQDTGCLELVYWDDPEGWYGEGGGRGCSGWGTRVHPWRIHVDVWQNQYNIVK